MSAGAFNIVIEQYATYALDLTVTQNTGSGDMPMDLSEYQPRLQMRETAQSQEILLACNLANGRIQTDALAGVIRITLSAEETGQLWWETAVYDLILEGPDTIRLLAGQVEILPGVTR